MTSNAAELPLAIVTVTYSPGEHLQPWIESARAATSFPVRIVLADNGSVDGVPEAAAADNDDVHFLPTGGNLGYGTGMNIGVRYLAAARAAGEINPDYVLISNPDVVFAEGSIDELLACAARHPEAGAIGPYIAQQDGSAYPSARNIPTLRNGIGHALFGQIWPSNPWTANYKAGENMDEERVAGWLSGSCVLLRWEAFEAIGGFDERYFMYMEDVDLGDRLTRAGWENIFCPTAVITHEVGHAAGKVPEKMLAAHHESAYRFQADRLTGLRYLPVRAVLWAGLKARLSISIAVAKLRAARR